MPMSKKAKLGRSGNDLSMTDTVEALDPALQDIAELALTNSVEVADGQELVPETPSKRGRGRPKGAKNKRTPTPDGDIPPEERYFFQTRIGPANQQPTSTNSFAELGLLNHEDYFAESKTAQHPHQFEARYLSKLHARAFPQWHVELSQNFSICLYGWGSKRQLVSEFAEYLCRQAEKTGSSTPRIVIVNGYAHRLNVRHVLNTIATALQASPDDDEPNPVKLIGQPQDVLDIILSRLDALQEPIYLLINSLDHASSTLRHPSTQALLARLSAHDKVHMICTCDTPTFQLLFPSNIRDTYSFVFHDATTFAAYEAETSVVDDVNELLGRKGRRVGGSQGIAFVLKSLPENARNLYRLLISEILSILADDDPDSAMQGDLEANGYIDPNLLDASAAIGRKRRTRTPAAEDVGIEYRTLYQKASEEFICSSDMNFRFLLKEFHDHQMITTKKDAGGTEILGVPLDRSEMELVLDELVL